MCCYLAWDLGGHYLRSEMKAAVREREREREREYGNDDVWFI